MHVVKFLTKLFLGLYLVFVGLIGVGVHLPFLTPVFVGFVGLVAGVLVLVKAFKCCCCHSCDTCDEHDHDKV